MGTGIALDDDGLLSSLSEGDINFDDGKTRWAKEEKRGGGSFAVRVPVLVATERLRARRAHNRRSPQLITSPFRLCSLLRLLHPWQAIYPILCVKITLIMVSQA